MELKDVLAALESAKTDAAINPEEWPAHTRPSIEIRKRQAQDSVESLTKQYRDLLRKGVEVIAVIGPEDKVAKFKDVVEDEGSSVVVDAGSLYVKLATPVDATIGREREFRVPQLYRLIEEMAEMGKQLGIRSLPYPNDPNTLGKTVPTFEDTVAAVRTSIRATGGDELMIRYIEEQALKEAEAVGYTQRVLPVVVFGLTEPEVTALSSTLFAGNVTIIDLSKDAATQNTLIKTYKSIKSKYKNGKTTDSDDSDSENE